MTNHDRVTGGEDLLKNISLFLLTEALLRGYQEEAGDIVRLARKFGVRWSDIKAILRTKRRWAQAAKRHAINERSIP